MKNNAASSMLAWLRGLLLLLAVSAGSAHAATYSGVWDPTFGIPFTNLGWRGTAEYFVPNSCVPSGPGIVDVDDSIDCGGGALVTSAQVEFYDTTDSGQSTISTLVFNPSSFGIGTLRFVSGLLTQLTTTDSNLVNPVENLWAFGVSSTTEFALTFTLGGPRLFWQDCGGYYASTNYSYECSSGWNDSESFPPQFTITLVPEPGTLVLACLALLFLAPRRTRAALWQRR